MISLILAPPLADAFLSRGLTGAQRQTLFDDRCVVIPQWISAADTDAIRADTIAVADGGGCVDSHVGTYTVKLDTSVRNSRQRRLYPPPPNSLGSVGTRDRLIGAVGRLRDELQATAACVDLQLPHLAQHATELTYLLYPQGGHYQRHLDVPMREGGWVRRGRSADDGGSLSGLRTRRVISFILYLNRGWNVEDGGALRLFPAGERGEGLETVHTQDVTPEGGTLVLLMSSDVEHRVRLTRRARQCVVGWFKEEASEGRVPDRDPMSLRSRHFWEE